MWIVFFSGIIGLIITQLFINLCNIYEYLNHKFNENDDTAENIKNKKINKHKIVG